MMGKGKNGVGFGKVDVTVEKGLQEEFDVQKAPELKLFFEGNRLEPISCEGNCLCVGQGDASCGVTETPACRGLTEFRAQCLVAY